MQTSTFTTTKILPGSQTVTKLSVKDNHKPIFSNCSNYKPTVLEEQPPGTYVFTMTAEDRDPPESGGTVTYQFVSTPGEKERFHIDPRSGVVTTADVFDRDEPSREKEAYVTVRASDNGQPQLDDACSVKVIIEDINDNTPVFDKVSYSESVPADLPPGHLVMRISATDIDDGNNSLVHYSLDYSSPDHTYFNIDPDTGVILLNKGIDKKPGYKFKLSAIVNDMGSPPLQTSIALDIQVVDSNKKSPSFVDYPDTPIRLPENFIDFDAHIATVKARSNIPEEEKLLFELVVGQTEQTNKWHTFILESDDDTAFIKLANHLDFEKITEYTLTVRVQNNYNLAAETIITIQILDVNDNIPIFNEVRSGSVLENEPPNTPVMKVKAIDADGTMENNQVRYVLADPTDPFAIDPISGEIITLKEFDREDRAFYNIKIIATDNSESALTPGKHNSGQQVFRIEIADKNDNQPKFSKDVYVAEAVSEDANLNELVTQVTALDIDTASIVTYSIVDGNLYDAFLIKNLTGEIRVNSKLDYENITTYTLTVRASDGPHEDYAKVKINIANVNDNPPIFLENVTKTIEEETLVEGCVAQVQAYDPDISDRNAPQNIKYSIVKPEQKEYFDVDDNGCITLKKKLDRDPPTGYPTWQVYVAAVDEYGGPTGLRSLVEVILQLTDINDNAPFLTNSQPVIWYENQPPGAVVTLVAKDNDLKENGPPFSFSLNSSASFDLKSKFQVQGDILYASVEFDREQTKEYFIPISITDSGSPRLTGVSLLHLVIGDRNDNAMAEGFSSIFVYNYKGETPDTEIGRVFVEDPDDWDLADKTFNWLPSFDMRVPYFDVSRRSGVITMKEGTPDGSFLLNFNVTEENEPFVPLHWVTATVNVTVKQIPEIAVDNSGSIRFANVTAEEFIINGLDGKSKKDILRHRLSIIHNTSVDNVDVFTVMPRHTVTGDYLDVRYSAHGSPYYPPQRLDSAFVAHQMQLEMALDARVLMVPIDECLVEKVHCDDEPCRNKLVKSNIAAVVYSNRTSFVGVSATVEPECSCDINSVSDFFCFNGGTPFADTCECPPGFAGPRCEQTSVGFSGNGFAMYRAPDACRDAKLALTLAPAADDGLVLYLGPLIRNDLMPIEDFLSLELENGYPVLLVSYGSGTTRLNHTQIKVNDGQPHLVEVTLSPTSIEMFVDRCKLSSCMSLAAPVGPNRVLNVNGPLQLGGASIRLESLGRAFGWRHIPTDMGFSGCISNLTYNGETMDLGEPAVARQIDVGCKLGMARAVSFGIDSNFLVAVLVCAAVLLILLLAVVVQRRRADAWAEKELDDIRENIIAYEDEGGGEGDAGYDLAVLRRVADDTIGAVGQRPNGVVERAPEVLDDVRHYAYEGDGNTSGSLSTLASCTDDEDLKFNYLSSFGPRFRKLADMYGDTPDDQQPHEESWC